MTKKTEESNGKDIITRIGKYFNDELEDIQEERKEIGKGKVSKGKLTNKIIKHDSWKFIKRDLIGHIFPKGNGGVLLTSIIIFILAALIITVLLGAYIFAFNTISDNLANDQLFGQVNMKDAHDDTFGLLNSALLKTGDMIGYTIIFAMVIGMFLNAFFLRGFIPKIFLIIDIFILVFCYILAVYVTDAYSILVNVEVLSVYGTTLSKTSTFMLNLPKFVSVIGVIMMVLSYSSIPKKTEDEFGIVGQ